MYNVINIINTAKVKRVNPEFLLQGKIFFSFSFILCLCEMMDDH